MKPLGVSDDRATGVELLPPLGLDLRPAVEHDVEEGHVVQYLVSNWCHCAGLSCEARADHSVHLGAMELDEAGLAWLAPHFNASQQMDLSLLCTHHLTLA